MSAWHKHPAWPGLRLAAKRRDGWACVRCRGRGRLEVDHVLPVERHPDLAFALDNLQTLCRDCHIAKTRADFTGELPPDKAAWRDAVCALLVKKNLIR